MRFDDILVGQAASLQRIVTESDVQRFAEVSGDYNPVHLDEEVATRSRFRGRIAHGMLSASFISAALSTKLPGPNVIYLSQSLRFLKPVRIGDTIAVHLEVLEITPEKRRLRLRTTCTNQHGQQVVEGEAVVLVPED